MLKVNLFKRFLPLLVALIFLFSVAGCGGNSTQTGSTGTTGTSGTTQTAAASTQAERVTVSMVINNQKGADDTDKNWKFQMVKKMEDILNINLNLKSETPDQDQLMVASGDLPDVFFAQNTTPSYLKQLIEGNLILPLDDLVDKYAPDLKAQTAKLDFSRKFLSNGTGKLYGITTFTGSDGSGKYPQIGFFTRWDYYKELGYPDVKDPLAIVDLVNQMVKAHPKTADGKKVYGFGVFTDWGAWPFMVFPVPSGWGTLGVSNSLYLKQDGSEMYPYTDFNGPFWDNLKIYNKANQLGIFDKDSLTQKSDEYDNKSHNGQYAVICASWWMTKFNQDQLQKDPNSQVGYELLPFDKMSVYANNINPAGSRDWLYVIGAKSKHPDAAMKLINYMNSYDGIRQLMSGTTDTTIETVDGKPELKTDFIQKYSSGDPSAQGIVWHNANLMGYTPTTVNPKDGQPLDLFLTPRAFALQNTPLDKAYSEHYGAIYPYGVVQKFINDGKMMDDGYMNLLAIAAMQPAPDDINRIDTNLSDIWYKAASAAILAPNDAAFQQVFNKCVSDLKNAGLQKSIDFWRQNFNTAKAATDAMK